MSRRAAEFLDEMPAAAAFLDQEAGPDLAALAGDVTAEAGGATAGQMLGALGGPVGVVVGGAIGGGAGNAVAQVRRMARGEQEDFRWGEMLGVAGVSAIPGGQLAKGATAAARIGRSAAVMGGAGTAGHALQQIVDEPAEELDLGRALAAGGLSAAGGGLVQGGIEAAKPALAALARLFPRAKVEGLAGKPREEVVAAIAEAEGLPPATVQQRLDEAIAAGRPGKSAQESAEVFLAAADAPAAAAAPSRFLPASDGTPDLGLLAPEVAESAGLVAAPIRFERQSLDHFKPQRLAEIRAAGYASPEEMAEVVARDFSRIYDGRSKSVWLVKPLDKQHAGAVELVPDVDGPYYRVNTLLVARPDFLKNRKPLWERAQSSQLPGESPSAVSGQSGRPQAGTAGGPVKAGPETGLYSEGGAINPAALFPVARAAVGGALGYATGDTPEDRVQQALLGMGFGAAASPALARRLAQTVLQAPAAQATKEFAREQLTSLRLRVAPQSILPAEIREQLRWGEQAAAAVTATGLSLTRDLERAIQGIGSAPAVATAAAQVKGFLAGQVAAPALPAPVRVAAQKVRAYIDSLTDRAIAEGVVAGEMAQTFLANRGTYLRRSYEIFLNPDYRPAPATIDRAIAAVAQANQVPRAEAEGIVAGLLDKHGRQHLPDFLLGRGKVAGKDVSSLVRRQDLLPEIRALLGEVQDPILAANQTIPRMARLLELDATQRQVRSIGQKLGLFVEARSLQHPSPLVAEGSAPHDRLAGLFAAPEIAAAFQKEAATGRTAFVPEMLWRTLTTASALAKTAKTVWNPESYVPNALGGILANVANANFRYSHAARGLALGAEELGALRRFLPQAPTRDALRAELGELKRLGVIGESVNSEDLLRTIESSFFARLGDRAKSVLTLPSKIYGSLDDFNRYISWQSERARYARAFPQMPPAELARHAAEVARATTPVYSEVPKLVKQLSIAGLAPSFVNFTWEVFRNTKNSVAIGLRDLQRGRETGNAALVRAGAERLAAVTAVVAGASMWGAAKLSRDSHGVSEEQDRAVRYFGPRWNREGMLLYHSPAAAGRPVQYSNFSYLVPQALLWQAIAAGQRGADEGRALPEFLGALNEQFGLGNSVLIPPVAAAVQGFDPRTGRKIPATAVDPTLGDRAAYVANRAFKPLVAEWIAKFNKARFGEKGDYGRVYSVKEQLQRLVGVRAQTLDPAEAVAWKARELGERFHAATDLHRLQQRKGAPPEREQQAYDQAQRERREQFAELQRMLGHARHLGVTDEQTIAAFRAARLPPEVVLGVLDGRYPDLARTRPKTGGEYLAELQARPARERAAALAEIYRQDPAMGRNVVGLLKTQARGRTEHDKLLLGLGVADGERAEYLRRKLGELPAGPERRAWLVEQRRKGILTDEVFRQMTTAPRK